MIELDPWQKQVVETKGNICLCSGRQVGKSTAIAIKAGEFATHNKDQVILIISAVERQALWLFEKTLAYLFDNYKSYIKKGKDRPTKHTIKLSNGSVIHSLPTGLAGTGIRGYTINMLLADEAAFIPDDVWQAVTPMLATTRGQIILLSTPHGREGYFYRCSQDESFAQFRLSSEECERTDKDFLAKEKERMTKKQYAQEYLGQFVEDLSQFFPDKLIMGCMTGKSEEISPASSYYLGIDVARMGEDESTFEIIKMDKEILKHVYHESTRKQLLIETTRKTIELESKYKFRKIYIDDGGIGVAVFEQLLLEPVTRRKTIAINNAARSLDQDEKQKTRLLKEDLYNNLLRLMEQGKIVLLDDPEIFLSLKSVQYEYADTGKLKIFGNYTHIAEGLIRAAWCIKDKSLNLWVRWS